jgi:four helix bundle protein
MMAVSAHRDLIVWQRSMTLARNVYAATANSLTGDVNELAMQMRRSAVSIASTIGEGATRTRRCEFRQLLSAARARLSELETQVMIATDLRILSGNIVLDQEIVELRQLLAVLIRKLSESKPLPPTETLKPTT